MLTNTQIERLAGMANQLRPEWPVNSLVTYIKKHRTRAYRDLAVALSWVATDSDSHTPARLDENGPWWKAAAIAEGGARRGDHTMRCAEHRDQRLPCPSCAEGIKPPPAEVLGDIKAALDAAKTTHHQREAEKAAREARRSE